MSGFRNAPGVTKFRRGMEFEYAGSPYQVLWVWPPSGESLAINLSATCIDRMERYFPPSTLLECTLDLDSIWEDKVYRLRNLKSIESKVLMVNDAWVAHTTIDGRAVDAREWFLDHYEPLPLNSPAEGQPAPAWKPEAGKECIHVNYCDVGERAIPVAFDGLFAWMKRKTDSRGFITRLSQLRPLPPDPPVKNEPVKDDDLVLVLRDGEESIGRACMVNAAAQMFQLSTRPASRWFDWTDPKTKVTHLVGAP